VVKGAIIQDELLTALRVPKLFMECVELHPHLEQLLLLLWEEEALPLAHVIHGYGSRHAAMTKGKGCDSFAWERKTRV
jgi:hypothetical protein